VLVFKQENGEQGYRQNDQVDALSSVKFQSQETDHGAPRDHNIETPPTIAALVGRPIRIRNFTLAMPPLKLAFGQIAIGPLNFACVAACLHQVLAAVGEVSYPAVATVYVLANVASLISHVPGGFGVIESVVLLLLPQANFIGALLVFRVLYFLVPLAIGGTTFAAIEIRRRQRKLCERGVD
jgi:glycosyltransferase 2 family protein